MIKLPQKVIFAVDKPFLYSIIQHLHDNNYSYYSIFLFNGYVKNPIE